MRVLACTMVFAGATVVVGAATAGPAGASVTDTVLPSSLGFGSWSVGVISGSQTVTVHNTGSNDLDITSINFSGPDADDFIALLPSACSDVAAISGTCDILFGFLPGALGPRSATATLVDNANSPSSVALSGTGTMGYYSATANGAVSAFGDGVNVGDASGTPLNKPIVSMASTGTAQGYWLVASDGGIFGYGDAQFFGSTGGIHLNKPIVGMASTFDGQGYWLVASDGGIFDYGDAPFFGSTGGITLNKPIVGMAPTPDGQGYWLVASDGGIFSYGDASFYGSMGGQPLNQPIVGMAATPDGHGYWLVASDGGIFAFGDAHFFGSTGAIHLNKPIVGMSATPTGNGYWFVASDGGIFNYGDAPFYGSTGGGAVVDNVAMASTGGPTLQAILDVPALRAHLVQHLERGHGHQAYQLHAG